MKQTKEIMDSVLPKWARRALALVEEIEDGTGRKIIPKEVKPFTNLYNPRNPGSYNPDNDFNRGSIVDADYREVSNDEYEDDYEDEYNPLQTQRIEWLQDVLNEPSGVHLILGKRGAGKTALSLRLAEIFKQNFGYKIYAMNMVAVPDFVDDVLEEIRGEEIGSTVNIFYMINGRPVQPNNSVVVIDDASTLFDSWNQNESARWLKYLMFVVRHKGVILILNSQEGAALNRYVTTEAAALWLKEPSLFIQEGERKSILKMTQEAQKTYETIPVKERRKYVYAVTNNGKGMIKINLPSGWSEAISRNKENAPARRASFEDDDSLLI